MGFEARLWAAADALRNNMDAAEYNHVVLGLIFLTGQRERSLARATARDRGRLSRQECRARIARTSIHSRW